MLHTRRQIILAIVERLKAGVDGVAVKAGRGAPLPVASAPYLLVHARREESRSIAEIGEDDRRLQRLLTVQIDIVHADPEDDDGEADRLSALVESAMAGDPTFGGIARDCELARSLIDARAEGETRIGRARLEFNVEYHTAASRPGQHL